MTTFSPNGLVENTDYYARVKHTGNLSGESPWSPTLNFKTKNQALPDTEIAILTYAQTDLSPDSVFYTYGGYFSSLKMSGNGKVIIGSANNGYNGSRGGALFQEENGVWSFKRSFKQSSWYSSGSNDKDFSLNYDGSWVVESVYRDRQNVFNGEALRIYKKSENTWSLHTTILSNAFTQIVGKQSTTGYVKINSDGSRILICSTSHGDSWQRNGENYIFEITRTNDVWSPPSLLYSITYYNTSMGSNAVFSVSRDFKKIFFAATKENYPRLLVRNSLSEPFSVKWITNAAPFSIRDAYKNSICFYDSGTKLAVVEPGSGNYVKFYDIVGSEPVLIQTLQHPEIPSSLFFGKSVAINNDSSVMVVGGVFNNSEDPNRVAYVYSRINGNWVFKHYLNVANISLLMTPSHGSPQVGRYDGMDISDDGSRVCLASFNYPSNPEAFVVFD